MRLKSILAAAALALSATTAHATVYTVPADVNAGHLNIRSGPGLNHSLLGAIPAGTTVNAGRCVPRDDRVAGGNWCLVTYNGVTGWASSSGLMPGYMPPTSSVPVPVPPGMDMQSTPAPYRGPYASMPVPTIKVEAHSLQCAPPLDRNDRNPVKSIWVSFDYDWTNRKMLSMTVNHERWNGQFIDRFQQYTDAQLKFDGSIFGWAGTYLRDNNMAGGAYMGQDGRWYYREKQWTNGVPQFDIIAVCQPTEAE